MTPQWLYDLFAILMLVVAAYSIVLFVVTMSAHRPAGWDVDVAHTVMGVSMAGMFVGGWAFGSPSVWEVTFGGLLTWFLARSVLSVRDFGPHPPHFLAHGVLSLAMVLMYAFPGRTVDGSMGSMSMTMPMSGGSRLDPSIALLLAFGVIASAIFTVGSSKKGASHHGIHALAYVGAGAKITQRSQSSETHSGDISIEDVVTRPWVEDASHVAMCVAMGFLLILIV